MSSAKNEKHFLGPMHARNFSEKKKLKQITIYQKRVELKKKIKAEPSLT